MNTENDPSSEPLLREHFQALRREANAYAPAWNPDLLQPRLPQRRQAPVWLFPTMAGAAAVAMLAAFWMSSPEAAAPRLSEALPVLLEAPSAPLFASLEDGGASLSPSDFLLPSHLQFRLP